MELLNKETETKPCTIQNVICCAFEVGQNAIVFNNTEWSKTGDIEQNQMYWQEAKILNLRYKNEWLADVEFESGLKSNGHFVRGINHCI